MSVRIGGPPGLGKTMNVVKWNKIKGPWHITGAGWSYHVKPPRNELQYRFDEVWSLYVEQPVADGPTAIFHRYGKNGLLSGSMPDFWNVRLFTIMRENEELFQPPLEWVGPDLRWSNTQFAYLALEFLMP